MGKKEKVSRVYKSQAKRRKSRKESSISFQFSVAYVVFNIVSYIVVVFSLKTVVLTILSVYQVYLIKIS